MAAVHAPVVCPATIRASAVGQLQVAHVGAVGCVRIDVAASATVVTPLQHGTDRSGTFLHVSLLTPARFLPQRPNGCWILDPKAGGDLLRNIEHAKSPETVSLDRSRSSLRGRDWTRPDRFELPTLWSEVRRLPS